MVKVKESCSVFTPLKVLKAMKNHGGRGMARQGSPLIGLLFIALIVAAGFAASETLGGGGAARVKPSMMAVTNVGPEGLEAVIYAIDYRGERAEINNASTWVHDGWELFPSSQLHYVKMNIKRYTKGIEDRDYTPATAPWSMAYLSLIHI